MRTTASSRRAYSAFPQHTKALIVALSALAGIFSPISSNIFVPAIPTLATAFHRPEQDISQAVTVFLVVQAITPSFFGSMSDSFGRRPVYVVVLSLYLASNVGLAVMPTDQYWLLLFLRALQATGGSAVLSIGSGCIADIAEPRERGRYSGYFQMGAQVGPCLGPFLGGLLANYLGWRSIFWFLSISTGVVLLPLIFFMPETLRSLVGDGSIPPPPICMSPAMLLKKRRMEKKGEQMADPVERPPQKKYDPLTAFKLLFVPEILLSFIFVSLLYMEFYCILTLNSTALRDTYGLSDLKIGLAYLPAGIGTICQSFINGRQLDFYYRREERRVGGDYRKKGEEFRLDWTRLRCLFPMMTCFLIATTSLGWCLEAHAPLAVTLVVQFFVGLGQGTINTVTCYGMDLQPGKGGAVSAACNLVRCLFGAVGVATVQLMYSRLGAGWTMTVLTGICIAGLPILFWVIRDGKKWRIARKEKEARKLRQAAEKAATLEAQETKV